MTKDVTVHIGIIYLDLYIESAHSLKDKRMVLKKLKNQIRSKFNVTVAELDGFDKWQTTCLGISMIGNDQRYIDSALQNVKKHVDHYYAVELVDETIEFI